MIAPRIDNAALAGALSATGGTGASALLDLAALLSVLCIAIYGRINAFLTYFSGWSSGGGRQIVICGSGFRPTAPAAVMLCLARRPRLAVCKTLAIQA